MTKFASDNVTPACPEVVEAIIEANTGLAASYGDDAWSLKLQNRLSDVFETDVVVFTVVTGTAANALALSALTPPYGKIYCHELSHINTDECGAPELFTGGAKLIPMSGESGKLNADMLAAKVYGRGNVHHAQPSAVSIAQSCETGAVYRPDEIAALAAAAREHGLKFHMDGARFANALVTLGASPAQVTRKSGVDVLSFGGTKNGCFAAEAVVFFDPQAAKTFEFLHKRSGQLLSKSRFVAAQLNAYISNDVWFRNARHANAMAKRLSEGLAVLPGIKLAYPTEANQVFVRLPQHIVKKVQSDGFTINEEELDGTAARFVTAWNTEIEDVDLLMASFSSHCALSSQESSRA
jgi:threonine aldolase